MGISYTPVVLKAAAFVAGRSFGVESSIVSRYAAVARVCRVVVLCRAQHCCGMFVANHGVACFMLASCAAASRSLCGAVRKRVVLVLLSNMLAGVEVVKQRCRMEGGCARGCVGQLQLPTPQLYHQMVHGCW